MSTVSIANSGTPAEGAQVFACGRIHGGERRMIVVQAAAPAPIPGPWDLHAVVAAL